MNKKQIAWLGSSKTDLLKFPDAARSQAGYQLSRIQQGEDADDAKPMSSSIGSGAYEIRLEDKNNTQFRVIYVAKFESFIYVLHCFCKKTRTTSQPDIEIAKKRYEDLVRELIKLKKQFGGKR